MLLVARIVVVPPRALVSLASTSPVLFSFVLLVEPCLDVASQLVSLLSISYAHEGVLFQVFCDWFDCAFVSPFDVVSLAVLLLVVSSLPVVPTHKLFSAAPFEDFPFLVDVVIVFLPALVDILVAPFFVVIIAALPSSQISLITVLPH